MVIVFDFFAWWDLSATVLDKRHRAENRGVNKIGSAMPVSQ
jgi:hypothetical protein